MRILPHVAWLRTWEHPASWGRPTCVILSLGTLDFGVLAARPGDELYIDFYFGWFGVQFDWGAR